LINGSSYASRAIVVALSARFSFFFFFFVFFVFFVYLLLRFIVVLKMFMRKKKVIRIFRPVSSCLVSFFFSLSVSSDLRRTRETREREREEREKKENRLIVRVERNCFFVPCRAHKNETKMQKKRRRKEEKSKLSNRYEREQQHPLLLFFPRLTDKKGA